MRLIYADLLDEEVMYWFMCMTGNPKPSTVVNQCKSSFRNMIDEQSTAYDVEAVVKDIQDIGTRFCASVHCNDECECCDHGSMMKAIIDIVRKGGVNTDVN